MLSIRLVVVWFHVWCLMWTPRVTQFSPHLHLLYLGGGHGGNSLSRDAPTGYQSDKLKKCLFPISKTHVDWLGKQYTLRHPVGGIELFYEQDNSHIVPPGSRKLERSQRWSSPPQSPQPSMA